MVQDRSFIDNYSDGYVWMDVQDFETPLPVIDGKITAKILKLDSIDDPEKAKRLRLRFKPSFLQGDTKGTKGRATDTMKYDTMSNVNSNDISSGGNTNSAPPKPPRSPVPLTSPQTAAQPEITPVSKPVVSPSPSASGKINRLTPPPPGPSTSSQAEDLLFEYSDAAPTGNQSKIPPKVTLEEDLLFGYTAPAGTSYPTPTATSTSLKSPSSVPATSIPVNVSAATLDIDEDTSAAPASWSDGLKAPAPSKGEQLQ